MTFIFHKCSAKVQYKFTSFLRATYFLAHTTGR